MQIMLKGYGSHINLETPDDAHPNGIVDKAAAIARSSTSYAAVKASMTAIAPLRTALFFFTLRSPALFVTVGVGLVLVVLDGDVLVVVALTELDVGEPVTVFESVDDSASESPVILEFNSTIHYQLLLDLRLHKHFPSNLLFTQTVA